MVDQPAARDVNPAQPPHGARRTAPVRRWLVWAACGVFVLVAAVVGVGLYFADDFIERRLRAATTTLLQERFDSEVEIADIEVRFLPTLSIRGGYLSMRHRGRRDIPPLITIHALTIDASPGELWNGRIDRVRLEGLEIVIPPRRGEEMPDLSDDRTRNRSDDQAPDVLIRELLSEHGRLTIMPKRSGGRAREFDLARIRLEDLQFSKATPFEASLTNPVPEGEIHAVGTFGPWQARDPSLTPVDGTFRFDADLGTIKGLGGGLRAEGSFTGPLERISTKGHTRTDDFRLSTGGAQFPLTVDYTAIVDGTSGDTFLESVEADLGRSHISAEGAVLHIEGIKGRLIKLTTRARGARLEDFIRLTARVKTSPIVGAVDLTATLDLPPGQGEVLDRLDLAGTFNVASARFTSEAIQDRIDELSRRGTGRPRDETIDDVASNLQGSFGLHDAQLQVRSLSFRVTGAEVRLAGAYGVRSEQLDFRGTLRLEAPVSKTQTGWKSIVLKLFDPLFRKDGAGTVLPIVISGTRDHPKFGIEIKKAILSKR